MYLLELIQFDSAQRVGLFETEEDIKNWLEQVDGLEIEATDLNGTSLNEVIIKYSSLPVYTEVEWKGSKFPLSKYMFENEDIIAIWTYMPLLSEVDGIVPGTSHVRNYIMGHDEVKGYVTSLDEVTNALLDFFNEKGMNPKIDGTGGEDGEFIYVDDKILIHLDAELVDEWDNRESNEAFLEAQLQK